ncbi:MAG: DUF362 domain-containing protein, partial [Candidatus Aenigmarchaeota archaeon]|nr:DUF362 domain-containing protein [Candidatus Aenigmarchaeota archaeon]
MVSEIFYQVTNNRMRFAEKITLKFMKEIKGKKKIFVKPNIVSHELYPTTTHPDVLRYVLKNLPRSSEIIIADAPILDSSVTVGFGKRDIIRNHPLAKVCKQLDLELQNLY